MPGSMLDALHGASARPGEAFAAACSFCGSLPGHGVALLVAAAAAICSRCLDEARAALAAPPPAPRRSGRQPPLAGRELYTGDVCDNCGSFRMVRSGTCGTCLDCGTSGGCG